MSTSLFDKIIFGPVHSRRLGLSLGVNLLLPSAKLCNFDCIYCECGWNREHPGGKFNDKNEVLEILESTIKKMVNDGTPPDFITFAGNGEPTMHPDFQEIIDGTIAIRNEFCPAAHIGVLTNGTMIDRESVRAALLKVDKAMVKFDSAFDATMQIMNQPNGKRTVAETIELMKKFEGHFIMQTMFLKGKYNDKNFDNTTKEEVSAWLKVVEEVRPREVMLYSIDRDTPHDELTKIPLEKLKEIAERVTALGITATAN